MLSRRAQAGRVKPTATPMASTVLILAVGLAAISMASVLIKLCQAPALVIASYRLTIAALFYLALGAVKPAKPQRAIDGKRMRWAGVSGLFLCLHFVAWISSLQYTSVASSVVLVQTAPVLVALGSYFVFKEKGSWRLVLGIALTLAGGVLISCYDFQGDAGTLKGNLLAGVGAVGAAGYLMFGRRLRQDLDTITYVRWVYSSAALATLLVAAMMHVPLWGYSIDTYLLLFLIALFPQVIGHTTLNWALKQFSATTVSIMTLAEPIGASLLAYFILREPLGWMKICGGAVSLIGIVLTLLSERKMERKNENQ